MAASRRQRRRRSHQRQEPVPPVAPRPALQADAADSRNVERMCDQGRGSFQSAKLPPPRHRRAPTGRWVSQSTEKLITRHEREVDFGRNTNKWLAAPFFLAPLAGCQHLYSQRATLYYLLPLPLSLPQGSSARPAARLSNLMLYPHREHRAERNFSRLVSQTFSRPCRRLESQSVLSSLLGREEIFETGLQRLSVAVAELQRAEQKPYVQASKR